MVNPEKLKRKIYQVQEFVDKEGHAVTTRALVTGGEKMYIGKGVAMVKTPQGTLQVPFEFPIEADTLTAAFDGFEDAARAKIPELQQAVQR